MRTPVTAKSSLRHVIRGHQSLQQLVVNIVQVIEAEHSPLFALLEGIGHKFFIEG